MSEIGQRILIFGNAGSGKSTLARRLGVLFSLPIFYLDKEIWLPGWRRKPDAEIRERINEIANQERWIIDGNCVTILENRVDRADCLIFLDINRTVCLFRAFRRKRKYKNVQREDLADGCSDKLDSKFLRHIWNFDKNIAPAIFDIFEQESGKTKYILKNNRQIKGFLAKAGGKAKDE